MNLIGRILAAICVVLFVISGVIGITFFNIEQKAFSSETYKQAFDNLKLYERMPAVLATALSTSSLEGGNVGAFLAMLSTEENFASLLPPQELKVITDDVLDSTFDYLNGRTDSAVVSMVSLKTYIAGEGGIKTVAQLLDAQPDCTLEQISQITFGMLSGGNLLLCNPPEELMGLVTPLIQSQLQVMTNTLPDEIAIISGEKSNTPDDPRLRLNRVRSTMKLTLAIPLLFLPAILVFAVRSLKDWLTWWGWPIFLTGGLSLIAAVLGSPIVEFVIGRAMQIQTADFMPPALLAVMRDAVGEITRQILNPVAIEGLILSALGLGMLVTAAVSNRLVRSNV